MFRKHWAETKGTVASVIEYSTKAGRMYSVVFTYSVDGHWCGGTFNTFKPHHSGESLRVLYDPADPDRNQYVEREKLLRWFYIAFFTLASAALAYLVSHPNVK